MSGEFSPVDAILFVIMVIFFFLNIFMSLGIWRIVKGLSSTQVKLIQIVNKFCDSFPHVINPKVKKQPGGKNNGHQ